MVHSLLDHRSNTSDQDVAGKTDRGGKHRCPFTLKGCRSFRSRMPIFLLHARGFAKKKRIVRGGAASSNYLCVFQ